MQLRPIFLAAFAAFLPLIMHAQTFNILWTKGIYADSNDVNSVIVSDLEVDSDGNTIVAGEYHTQLVLSADLTLPGESDAASFFIAKYDRLGTPLWARRCRQIMPDDGAALVGSGEISLDQAGNIYWAANYEAASLDFGNGVLIQSACNGTCQEGFIAKYSGDGLPVFFKGVRAATGMEFEIAGIDADQTGVHYITGRFLGTELWLGGGGNFGGLTTDQYFLAKYSASGASEWVTFLNTNGGTPYPQAISVSPDGARIAVAGYYTSPTLDFGNGQLTSGAQSKKNFVVWYQPSSHPIDVGTLGCDFNLDLLSGYLDENYAFRAVYDYRGTLAWNDTIVGVEGLGDANHVVAHLQSGATSLSAPVNYSGLTSPMNSIVARPNTGTWLTGGFLNNSVALEGQNDLSNTGGCRDLMFTEGSGDQFIWAANYGGEGCEESENVFINALIGSDEQGCLRAAGSFSNGAFEQTHQLSGKGAFVMYLENCLTPATVERQIGALQMTPNPAHESVTIESPALTRGDLMQVFSCTGALQAQFMVDQNPVTLDVSNWPKGVYFLQTINKQGTIAHGKVTVF